MLLNCLSISISIATMPLFSYQAWGIDTQIGFDPSKSFVRSHFISPLVLAIVRAVLCLYSFTTMITCYAWLAHQTATIKLKDVNIGSYTIQQSDAAIGQSFSFFSTSLTHGSCGEPSTDPKPQHTSPSGLSDSTSSSQAPTPSFTSSPSAHGWTSGPSHSN